MRKALLITLFSLMVPLFSLEIGLRLFDPWGAYAYYDDLRTLSDHYWIEGLDYTLPPGTYSFHHWQATVTWEGRFIPDTADSPCTIALLGDSVTFGYAVNDVETFANQLARQFPTLHFINRGMVGYNAAQVAAVADGTPALYLLIHNDAQANTPTPPLALSPGELFFRASIIYYRHYQARQVVSAVETPIYPDWFWQAVEDYTSQSNHVLVAFDNDTLADVVAKRYPVARIPYYGNHHISAADPHPNPEGHRIIAAHLAPIVKQLSLESCPAHIP